MVSLPRSLIILLTIVSSVAAASPLMLETTTCFTGDFKSFETFHDSIKRSQKREVSEGQKQRMRESYTRWKQVDQEKVDCKIFTYAVDDIPVSGFLLKPKNVKESDLLPAIFNRGGNADGVFRTPYLYDKLAPFAEKGFFVIGSFYRGANINGVVSSHRLTDQFGGEDVNDVLRLLPIIDSIEGLKGKKVGMWGVSRGGMMAFLAAKRSDRFSAIVSDSAPVDLVAEAEASNRMETVFETWIPNYRKRKDIELKKRSVAYWHEEIGNIPLLILHGTDDRRVSAVSILEFSKQLQLSGHPYELLMYHAGGHGLRGFEAQVNAQVEYWLRKHAQ